MMENESSDESENSSTDSWIALPLTLREFKHSPLHWAAMKEFEKNLRGTVPTAKVAGMNTYAGYGRTPCPHGPTVTK